VGDIFSDGNEASRQIFVNALEQVRTEGQTVLDSLEEIRLNTLVRFEQGLNALAGRRQRVNRLLPKGAAGAFFVSDFLDIDQTKTNASVRADSGSTSLQERRYAPNITIQSQQFSASRGSVSEADTLYQVYDESGLNPVGTFDLEFGTAVNLTMIVFDLVSTPSNPAITISTSANGVYYTNARQQSANGNRVTAWFDQGEVKYLRVQIAPSHPDNIGGYTFTFGLTSFTAYQVSYQLQSDLVTKTLTVRPQSSSVVLTYDAQPGVSVFAAVAGGAFAGVSPGTELAVPGAVDVSAPVSIDETGQLSWGTLTLPDDLYAPSLRIVTPDGTPFRLAFGLDPVSAASLGTPVICVWNHGLYYRPYVPIQLNPALSIHYTSGPASFPVVLRVQLVTRDRAQTPVFAGVLFDHNFEVA
jgi:hypothetical protein